ncbi:MAG: amidohydrolase/deacetylase family metallohydrolase [Gemmataceae bacterium]
MCSSTRRQFLQQSLLGSLLLSAEEGFPQLRAQEAEAPAYDLLIREGRVVDPSQELSAVRDVAIVAGKVARIAENIDAKSARQVLEAKGKIVTPGLIDAHVHVFDGVAPLGIPADVNCIAKGVTTVLDAGSAGAHTFPAFRKNVINVVDTRVFALLNLSVVGQSTYSKENPYGELLDLRFVNPKLAIRTIEQNRDAILGIKIRLSDNIAGERDLKIVGMAKEAAAAVKLPLMVHIGATHSPLPDILRELRKGDVVTHCFHGREGGILDAKGRVLPDVKKAVERGVHLDVGHGAGSFAFDVAEKALKQDVLPGTISSDVHQFNVHGPVFDLATTLSKFLYLGMSLEEVIRRATMNPAAVFAVPKGLGSLKVGSIADVAIFALDEGDFTFVDAHSKKRIGKQKLRPVATVKAGKPYGGASIPVPE